MSIIESITQNLVHPITKSIDGISGGIGSDATSALWSQPSVGSVSAMTDEGSDNLIITPVGINAIYSGTLEANVYQVPAATGTINIGDTTNTNFLHDGSKFTIAGLVYMSTTTGLFRFTRTNGGSSSNVGMSIYFDNRASQQSLLMIPRKGYAAAAVTGAYSNSQWFHFCLVQDGDATNGSWKAYVDGVEVATFSTAVAATIGSSNHALLISGTVTASLRNYCIFRSAFTPAQVADLRAYMLTDTP